MLLPFLALCQEAGGNSCFMGKFDICQIPVAGGQSSFIGKRLYEITGQPGI